MNQKDMDNINKGSITIFECIKSALECGKGALIGRQGSTEMTSILSNDTELYINTLEVYSGVFAGSIEEWAEVYKEACSEADIMAAGWYKPLAEKEINYIKTISKAELIPLRSLEPYYSSVPWSSIFSGRRVTVVSSFAESMKGQIGKDIWGDKPILPEASWSFVRSYFCPKIAQGSCEWPPEVSCWKTAVDYLEKEVVLTSPEIVLIGCGGLAMPLALRLKRRGIIVVVLGGAIQILFGIKGFRWEGHLEISSYFNDSWVFPSEEEVPLDAKKIEQGCYW